MGSCSVILATVFATLGSAAQAVSCDEAHVWVSAPDPVARFTVDLAQTPQERGRGLMFVEEMPRSAGMLFVFPDEQMRSFWMRNTLISLDIIYADAAGQVVSIQADAVPLDETPLPSDGAAQFVLEINGGLAAELGIGPGAVLSHPAINQNLAAIPCS